MDDNIKSIDNVSGIQPYNKREKKSNRQNLHKNKKEDGDNGQDVGDETVDDVTLDEPETEQEEVENDEIDDDEEGPGHLVNVDI